MLFFLNEKKLKEFLFDTNDKVLKKVNFFFKVIKLV